VPRYLLADCFDDGVTYWIQTALPGAPPAPLRHSHVTQVCALIDAQAGRALSSESDWSAYVLAVVFQGESGWRDSLEQYSTATRAVLARLTDLVAGKEVCRLRRDDIVHGDLGPDNLLVVGDRVSGIVDWDAAGSGDRSLDLSKLLFYAYDDPAIRADVWARIVAISGRTALDILLAYNILAQLGGRCAADRTCRQDDQAPQTMGARPQPPARSLHAPRARRRLLRFRRLRARRPAAART